MKFAALICFSVIILFFCPYSLSRHVKRVPDWDTTLTSNTLIYPGKINPSIRDSIVAFGMELLGTPYVSGGCSKNGFDCSGFVFFVFRHFNIQVPRSSSQFSNFGKDIPVDSLSKGDILVFLSPTRNVIGHLGIVTKAKGMESEFIHASSGNEMKVILTNLNQERYRRRFVKAVNVAL